MRDRGYKIFPKDKKFNDNFDGIFDSEEERLKKREDKKEAGYYVCEHCGSTVYTDKKGEENDDG